MSLISEDGSIVTGAESYLSVVDCLTYHADRGNDLWATITTAQQEQALRRATDFMMGRYRGRWKGRRRSNLQTLDWPRVGVVIEDLTGDVGVAPYGLFQIPYTIVPKEVKDGCAELAYRAAMGPLADDQGQKVIQETVGPITVKYDPNASQQIRYVQVDAALQVYLNASSSGAMVKLIRT